jgi:hypothetical protein
MRHEPCLMLANSDGTVPYFDEYKTGRGPSFWIWLEEQLKAGVL